MANTEDNPPAVPCQLYAYAVKQSRWNRNKSHDITTTRILATSTGSEVARYVRSGVTWSIIGLTYYIIVVAQV